MAQIHFIGNVGHNAESKPIQQGGIVTFSVADSITRKNDNGEYVTDTKALSKLNCQKYRIKKLTGFDKLDITTIDTVVEEIKEA